MESYLWKFTRRKSYVVKKHIATNIIYNQLDHGPVCDTKTAPSKSFTQAKHLFELLYVTFILPHSEIANFAKKHIKVCLPNYVSFRQEKYEIRKKSFSFHVSIN